MNRGAARAPDGDDGFSLLELLVALALTVVLVAAIGEALRFAAGERRIALERNSGERASDLARAIGRLVERSFPARAVDARKVARSAFVGGPGDLRFVSIGVGETLPAGLLAVAVSGPHAGARRCEISWRDFRAGDFFASERSPGDRWIDEYGVAALRFRYHAPARPGSSASWSDRWSDADALPDATEITVIAIQNGVERRAVYVAAMPVRP
ncbi:MAG: prepilin-type N-terminal cleavage/methylation domain-containing protein [Hyphomicrobiales bacterium]|nr:prepilin-type N-terminal cleavage/methylation domain-containing protein [Hyphomicrobiales bacterium]MDE2016818.1 prepilin-type N-terminal cleavage/methylation domain-containing protein [Hyphomicrobiales bacterium]